MDRILDVELAEMLLSAAPDAMMLVDEDGVIQVANDAACRMFRPSDPSLAGTPVESLVPEGERTGHAVLRKDYLNAPSRRPMGSGLQLQGQREDGSLFPVEISLSPVNLGDGVMTIAAVRDVTDRQKTMARLTLLHERERIGRDIHDMVIQRIFAAGMSIQSVVGLVDSPTVRDRLTEVTEGLDETIRQLRQAIFELGQFHERQTLSSQLATIVDERANHLGFLPELRIIGHLDDLPDFVADQMIATFSESLSNVARHADATEAQVTIEFTDGQVSMIVEDNGVGIARRPKTKGGLSNMMWRAAELGGSCSIEANSPSGTRVVWEIPLTLGTKR
jgi:PAS domain S-box-containing protein